MTDLQRAALAARREIQRREQAKSDAERLKGDFAAFVRASWHVVEPAMPLIDNWHIDALCTHLQAVAEGRIRKLMINIGPGYAKSVIASVMFSAWLWARKPQTRIIAATYAAALTVRDSIRTRDLIMSEWFQGIFNPDWGVSRQTRKGQAFGQNPDTGHWEMVKSNEDFISNSLSGSRLALSVGGKATGFRADGQIFDDLLNATDQHSEAARKTATEWAIRTMSSRYNDMRIGWRVVIGQRLHESDPYGAMLASGEYEHLCLPSEFEPERRATTSIGWTDPRTEPGQLLFPELFTAAVLAQAKIDLLAYGYAGQHQQRPAPAEGGLFKRTWWRYYRPEEMPRLDVTIISVDATFKDAKDTDFVAIHVYGFAGPRMYLRARRHDRMGFTATKESIRILNLEFRPDAILIEDKANGPAIIEELQREIMGVIAITPEGGKVARAWAASPAVESGSVYLPADDPGAQEMVNEAAAFPNGAHDDDVDAFSQARNWQLKNNDLSIWTRLGGG